MKHQLHIYENAEATARAIADLIFTKAKEKTERSQFLNIAVSGGSTPKSLFNLLSEEFSEIMPWQAIRLFWVDERCVEPTHPESNFGMTYDALLHKSFIPSENIFRMKGEDIPDNEADNYQRILKKELPAQNGYPVFDLILLGIGDDGHTASIFPNDMTLLNGTPRAVAVGTHPVSGQKRITLTGKTITQAHQVVFLVTGANKAVVLRQIIKEEPEASCYPSSYVYNNKGKVDYYIDQDAAREL